MNDRIDHMTATRKRLEAAAPEMLVALKSIADQTNAVQHSQETRLNDIYDIARTAIAKAEDRS